MGQPAFSIEKSYNTYKNIRLYFGFDSVYNFVGISKTIRLFMPEENEGWVSWK